MRLDHEGIELFALAMAIANALEKKDFASHDLFPDAVFDDLG